MNCAPQVLVAACYRNADDADRIRRCLSRQTYRDTQLVFVRRDEKESTLPPDDSVETHSPRELIAHLKKSGAQRILFWPDEGDLKEAAIEKLVLALQVAPDQNGVADAARASTGLWLARNVAAMTSLNALWFKSQAQWIEECMRCKPGLFYVPENLLESSDPSVLRRPYAVEDMFGKLPLRFENYQEIATAPIWTLPEGETDDRSVLFLVSDLQMGGTCKFILDIASQLKAQGHRVTVATTAYDINGLNNLNRWLDELLRIVPDVFILSQSRPVELPRVSFLDYTHFEYEGNWPNGGYAQRSVGNQPLLDISMVSSEHLRQWMIARGADEEGLRVCHTNIDTEKWTPNAELRARVRYELGINPKTVLILYPCRLAEQKRPELMCNIVAELRRVTQLPFVVCVAGDGPLMPPLKKFVEKQGLAGSFRLLGAVSLQRVAELHNASDIFLLPSLIEGIALALFEAMALESVPVVADVGGQRELVTPECGHLIPLGPDVAQELTSYVTVLQRLLENPQLLRQQAIACRARVRNYFRLDQMGATFIAAMQEAGLRHHRRPVRLPEPAVCREQAALAIEYIRLMYQGAMVTEHAQLLQEQVIKQHKIIAKLHRQLESAHSANLIREENEIPC